MDKNKKVSLVIALSLPVIMIIVIGLSIYLPSMFIKPQTDFIFCDGGDQYTSKKYSVSNGKIVENEITYPDNYVNYNPQIYIPKLYYYDVLKDQAREISFEEAGQWILDDRYQSVDGFQIEGGGNYYGFLGLFGGESNYFERYLTKGSYNKKLNLNRNKAENYFYNFRFIGWVKG